MLLFQYFKLINIVFSYPFYLKSVIDFNTCHTTINKGALS